MAEPHPDDPAEPARHLDVHVVVRTAQFAADLAELTGRYGFRVDAIFPADAPATAVVSTRGVRLRLESAERSEPVDLQFVVDAPGPPAVLPGGTRITCVPADRPVHVPANRPSLVVTHDDGDAGVGRAGMRYRDLLPDRWGGRFIASLISIPDGGPVPDYVHFHKIRFQLIVVKEGWVRVVYEGQGEPFVLERGDLVIQPPQIRHRVLEASPGLQVVEIGCPAEHETIADWSTSLPDRRSDPAREWEGQRFVHHVAAGSAHHPWRPDGWEYRESGVAAATKGLAGVRVARPVADRPAAPPDRVSHDTEFAMLVVLRGEVGFEADGRPATTLRDGSAVAVPGGTGYRLVDPTDDCELLDVTLPATW